MTYIWLDVGDKLCWVAYTLEWVIFTHPSVPRVQIVSKLTQLVTEKNAHTIVVGLPYDLYGVEKKQLDKTQKFIEKLKNIFPNVKIVWEDERFTTFESYEILGQYEKKEKFKEKKDSLSAFLILESYLKRHS